MRIWRPNSVRRSGELLLLLSLVVSGCARSGQGSTGPATSAAPTPASTPASTASTQTPGPGASAVVVFVKDGDLLVWDEATGQTQTLFDAGDAISVTMSDDGQVVAFLRRTIVQRSELDWYEQSALWAVDRNGEDPRELVSAEQLRGLLSASETDSTNIPQMEWIPRTHRLLFSGWTYFVQAEGESHAVPEGLYLIDADTLTHTVLVPAGSDLRFVPAPDGGQIALMSATGLSFINTDGSGHGQDVLNYPNAGELGPLFPTGVWTQDSRAFVITGPGERNPSTNLNFTIWLVPVDGTPAQPLAAISDSVIDSVTFSPDGRHAAFVRAEGPAGMPTDFVWTIIPLTPEAGPLAVPRSSYLFWKNLHWSPAGVAYAVNERTLVQLCPNATQDSEVCDEVLDLGGDLAAIHWIDRSRFLFVTREPYDLYFGNLDGTRIRIAEGAENFAAVAMTCHNDSVLVPQGAGAAQLQAAPDTLVRATWRIRNTGTCAWDPSYRLAFLSGERMSGPRSLPLGESVAPGGEIELSVILVAPGVAGTYQAQWQLSGLDGTPFGAGATVDIVVPFDEPTALRPDQIVARVAVGSDPSRVAVGEGAAWVTNESAGTVSRIDLDTNQVVATVPVGNLPRHVAVGYGAVWVGNLGDGTVSRIEPSTNRVSATIPLEPSTQPFIAQPLGIAAGVDSIWVSSGVVGAESGTVFRIDPATNQVVASIEVERWPAQVAATEDAVWVTHSVTPFLSRIDPATNEVSATLSLECPTMGLAADATGVWAACVSVPVLFRIEPLTNQPTARIAVGYHSEGVALGPNGLWVTSNAEDTLTWIDPYTNLAARVYSVGLSPLGVAAAQDELWVVMSDEDTVWKIRP